MWVPAHPLDPETALRVQLNALASRSVYDTRAPAEVIAELGRTAGERTDLLGAELGLLIGF